MDNGAVPLFAVLLYVFLLSKYSKKHSISAKLSIFAKFIKVKKEN